MRLPFAELEQYLEGEDYAMRGDVSVPMAQGRVMPGYIAHLCGVDRQTVHRWRQQGLSLHQADRAACAIGVHPLLIWPQWGKEEEECA